MMANTEREPAETTPFDLASLTPEARAYVEGLQAEIAALNDRLTEQNRRIRELRHDVVRDPLTGLLNRRGFERVVVRTLDFVRRYGSEVALVFIDMDEFKRVNDTFGHAAGDRVLAETAALIRHTLRSSDVIGRIGGDEFVALLWKADVDVARRTARRVAEVLAGATIDHEGNAITVTASVGVTMLAAGDDVAGVLDRADQDMYRAKGERSAGA